MVNTWSVATASVRGSAHVRGDLPNQDAVVTRSWADDRGIVVAVSDGHGSRDSFRSDVGAQLAASIAADAIVEWLAGLDGVASVDEMRSAVPSFTRTVVDRWSEAVHAHLDAHPVDDAELVESPRGRAGHEADPLRAYGTTLIVAVLTTGSLMLVQIGDGDVLLCDHEGAVTSPVPPDAALIANETTSLCLVDAWSHARSAVLDLSVGTPIKLLLLATDGYGNSFAESTWREDLMGDLVRLLDEHGLDWVGSSLESWIAESADIAGDDVSVALVVPSVSTAPR